MAGEFESRGSGVRGKLLIVDRFEFLRRSVSLWRQRRRWLNQSTHSGVVISTAPTLPELAVNHLGFVHAVDGVERAIGVADRHVLPPAVGVSGREPQPVGRTGYCPVDTSSSSVFWCRLLGHGGFLPARPRPNSTGKYAVVPVTLKIRANHELEVALLVW